MDESRKIFADLLRQMARIVDVTGRLRDLAYRYRWEAKEFSDPVDKKIFLQHADDLEEILEAIQESSPINERETA